MNPDTPRTDAAANESIVKVYETSQQLERELAEMTARACSLAAHLPPETIAGDVQKWRDEYLATQCELAEARETVRYQTDVITTVRCERDRLAEALRKCREDSVSEHQRMLACGYGIPTKECADNIRRADAALASLKS